MTGTASDRLSQFHQGIATDHRGRLLRDILAWDDARLEAVHDFIQWMFPLPEPSGFNPHAPVLTGAAIADFRGSPVLQASLRACLARMRSFYALPPGEGPPIAGRSWLTPGNHNGLRLSRILRSLTILGLADEAKHLLAELEALYEGGAGPVIGEVTLGYWRRAVA